MGSYQEGQKEIVFAQPYTIKEGDSTIDFFYFHQNVYSEVASKKHRKAFASNYTTYQNKYFN